MLSPAAMPKPTIHTTRDPASNTTSYIIADPVTEEAVIINPVLNFDVSTNKISTKNADSILKTIEDEGYSVTHILETAIHKSHVSSCRYLRDRIAKAASAPRVCTGRNLDGTRGDLSPDRTWPDRVSVQDDAFDRLFADGEKIRIGNIVGEVVYLATDGEDMVGYVIGNNVFVCALAGWEEFTEESRGRLFGLGGDYKIYGINGKGREKRPYVRMRELQAQRDVVEAMSDLGASGTEPGPSSGTGVDTTPSTASTLRESWCSCSDKEDVRASTSASHSKSVSIASAAPNWGSAEAACAKSPRDSSGTQIVQFYATQINMRGGRIPKKINLMAQLSSQAAPGDGARLSLSGDTRDQYEKGEEMMSERRQSKQKEKEKEVEIRPLLIPKKLEGIMC